MSKAYNRHIEVKTEMLQDQILDRLRRLAGSDAAALNGRGRMKFFNKHYGQTSINVIVDLPLVFGDRKFVYHDQFSLGTATRNDKPVLRLGAARRWLKNKDEIAAGMATAQGITVDQVDKTAINDAFWHEENWVDKFCVEGDPPKLWARKNVMDSILKMVKANIELAGPVRSGAKTNSGLAPARPVNPPASLMATGTEDDIPF